MGQGLSDDPANLLLTHHLHQKKHCHICGKECYNKESLKDHLNTAHDVGEGSFSCKFCEFTSKSKSSLKSHIQAKHKVENHKQCPYCEYHTHMIHRIQVHIDSKHPEHDKKRFNCDHCSRRFIFENSLKHHMETIRNGPKNWAKKKIKRSIGLENSAKHMIPAVFPKYE